MKKRILVIVLVFLSYSTNFVFGINPDTSYVITPNMMGLIYKEFKVITDDNYYLNVWFYPSQYEISVDSIKYNTTHNISRKYEIIATNKPTIIICNGDSGNMSYLVHYAQFLSTNGYNVVTFDWRGFGKSQNFSYDSNIVCQEFLWDYNAVLDTLLKIPEVDSTRIGAFGYSTGAYISFLQFHQKSEIKAVVLRGMFTSYKEASSNLDNLFPKENHIYPKIFDSSKYIADEIDKEITKPVFFIVGELDQRTPPHMSLKLMNEMSCNYRSLWIVKGADHGGYLAPEIIQWEEFKSKVLSFFNTNL